MSTVDENKEFRRTQKVFYDNPYPPIEETVYNAGEGVCVIMLVPSDGSEQPVYIVSINGVFVAPVFVEDGSAVTAANHEAEKRKVTKAGAEP